MGFSLPYSTKELDAWDSEAVVNVIVQISSLFRNSFVLLLQAFGSSCARSCFHYEDVAEEDVFVFCLCKVFGLSSCGRIIESLAEGLSFAPTL